MRIFRLVVEPYLAEVKSMLGHKDVEVRLATITSLADLKNKDGLGSKVLSKRPRDATKTVKK
jgi:hypothetical protein